jgi:transcriptional regulator with XRE-family HTH domain
VSLADIKAYTGIKKSNLSRLEHDPLANPRIDTLCRYAEAVGKEIRITLVDISKENSDAAVVLCSTTCLGESPDGLHGSGTKR